MRGRRAGLARDQSFVRRTKDYTGADRPSSAAPDMSPLGVWPGHRRRAGAHIRSRAAPTSQPEASSVPVPQNTARPSAPPRAIPRGRPSRTESRGDPWRARAEALDDAGPAQSSIPPQIPSIGISPCFRRRIYVSQSTGRSTKHSRPTTRGWAAQRPLPVEGRHGGGGGARLRA